MHPKTRYVRSTDCHIAYQVLGTGPFDLIFVPGLISHLDLQWSDPIFSRALRRLASFSRLIIFDNRGTGLSDAAPGAPTLERRVDDVRAVMEAAGSTRAALIGLCTGGPTSLLFAAAFPERVSALVVCSSFAKGQPDEVHPSALPPEAYERIHRALERWGEGATLELFTPSVARNSVIRRLYAIFERAALSPGMALGALEALLATDVTDILPTITTPTLVTHCAEDYVSVEAGRYLAQHIQGARFLELPGADHVPFAGHGSEPLLDVIEEFLTGRRSAADPERAVATVVFTDIVGSTERAIDLGDRRWRELLEQHNSLVREEIDRHRGREVKTTGDGFLVAFDGPERAVRCAHAVCERAPALGLQVRAGVHTGECLARGEDLIGATVHIGARLAALAGPGEVVVSSAVRRLVQGSGLEFSGRGECALKGVPGLWSLFALSSVPAHGTVQLTRQGDHGETLALPDRAVVALARRAPWIPRSVTRLAGLVR